MNLREALSIIPDPRGCNKQYPLWGLIALILVAFLSRIDSLRGVSRFARNNPHLLPYLGLRKPPGHYTITTILHRISPEALQEALQRAFPMPITPASSEEVWVVDGKTLRGSRKASSPQVKLVEVLTLHLRATLAQAKAQRREEKALLGLLERLGAEALKGKLVVGDAGYLYPEVAEGIVQKGGPTSSF